MKSKSFKACLIGILAAFSILAYAAPVAGDYDKVIKEYIESQMNGDYKILKKIMSDNAAFNIPRAEKVVVQTKPEILTTMKEVGEAKHECRVTYEVVARSNALVMAQVEFSYPNCTQQNFLVLEKDDNKEWKIAQVYKIFNDKEPIQIQEKAIANN